ncbi:myb-like protein D [Trachinotus anak]|uniref:myb-like protein D n=1 Tax=Trachinotus anak TaxID=443729 RepID=UPI0039F18B39
MDGRGDGEHNGRNRPHLIQIFPRVDRPPADQLHAGVIAWLEFLFNHGLQVEGFAVMLDILNPEDDDNNDNENPDNNDNENPDNNDNDDVNDENLDNDDNNENLENNNVNNENADNNDNNNVNDENLDNENNANDENRDNNDSNENNDNSGNHGNADNLHIHNDNVDDNVDNNNEHARDAGTSTGVEVDQGVEDEDPLPGGSRRRSSEEEDEQDNEDRSSKQFRWWDELADSSTDSDTNSNDTERNTRNSPVKYLGADVEVAEEDPLPGPSRKRSRELDTVEDKRSDKNSRRDDEFVNNIVTFRTDEDLAHSIDLAVAEETGEEVNQQVEEEATQPRPSRKMSRDDDEDKDREAAKIFRS